MKLSTAIRIGSITSRQIISQFTDGKNGRCALGAALEAMNYNFSLGVYLGTIEKFFPITTILVEYPIEHKKCMLVLGTAVWNLNDIDGWTREQIANWVEQIENELENKQVQENNLSEKCIQTSDKNCKQLVEVK